MSQIFISYSRKELAIAEKIIDALAKDDLEPWVDWKSIPKGETFEQEIQQGIEAAEIFLFLVSPDSVQSEWCNKEVAHAVRNGKRILPIVIRDTDPKIIHSEISKRNWIFCRDGQDDFNKAIEETHKTIRANYDWSKYHTELQVKALRWERKQDASRLLRGKELREAEEQLAEINGQEEPQPTKIQREYIFASQKNEIRQRRQVTISLAVGLAIVAALAVFSWGQRNIAINQKNIADAASTQAISQKSTAEALLVISQANELAAQAEVQMAKHPDLAFLLAIRSFQKSDNWRTRQALAEILQFSPNMIGYLFENSSTPRMIAISPDGKTLAIGNSNNTVTFWDTATRSSLNKSVGFPEEYKLSGISALAFSPDGNRIAFGINRHWSVFVWDISSETFSDTVFETKYPKNYISLSEAERSSYTITSLSFSRDGRFLAADGPVTVRIWDTITGNQVFEVEKQDNEGVSGMTFSPNGRHLAIYGEKRIKVFSLDPAANPCTSSSSGELSWALFSPDSSRLAIYYRNANSYTTGNLVLVDATDCSYQQAAWIDEGASHPVFNTDGSQLQFFASDLLKVFDLEQEVVVSEALLPGHYSGYLQQVAFSSDKNRFASLGSFGEIVLWDTSRRETILIGSQFFDTEEANSIAPIMFNSRGDALLFRNQEHLLLLDYSDSKIEIHDAKNEQVLKTYEFNISQYLEARVDEETTGVAITGLSNNGGMVEKARLPHEADMFAFSRDGKVLATGICPWTGLGESCGGYLGIYDALTGDQIGQYIPSGEKWSEILAMALSADGSLLATSACIQRDKLYGMFCELSEITFWNTATGIALSSTVLDGEQKYLTISADGKHMISGRSTTNKIDDEVAIWDLETYQPFGLLSNFIRNMRVLTLSDDSRFVAVGAWDGSITLLDSLTLQPIIQIHAAGLVNTLMFNPDSTLLVSKSTSGSAGQWKETIEFWDIDPRNWIDRICDKAGRNFSDIEWAFYFSFESHATTCPQWPDGQ